MHTLINIHTNIHIYVYVCVEVYIQLKSKEVCPGLCMCLRHSVQTSSGAWLRDLTHASKCIPGRRPRAGHGSGEILVPWSSGQQLRASSSTSRCWAAATRWPLGGHASTSTGARRNTEPFDSITYSRNSMKGRLVKYSYTIVC